MNETVVDEMLQILARVKNEVSLNSSLYTLRELEDIQTRCEEIRDTIEMNTKHLNYYLDNAEASV